MKRKKLPPDWFTIPAIAIPIFFYGLWAIESMLLADLGEDHFGAFLLELLERLLGALANESAEDGAGLLRDQAEEIVLQGVSRHPDSLRDRLGELGRDLVLLSVREIDLLRHEQTDQVLQARRDPVAGVGAMAMGQGQGQPGPGGAPGAFGPFGQSPTPPPQSGGY